MIAALLIVTYVPSLTVVPEAERTGTVQTLVAMVHTSVEESRVTVHEITLSRDLDHDGNWPNFGPAAAALGLRSQMGIRMTRTDAEVTGLNLYSESTDAFDPDSWLPSLFASHASVALGYATKLQSLQGALESRETVGTAIGIVMERYGITSERAFEFLIRMSQNSNTKLRDIASELVKLNPGVSTTAR